MSYGFGYLQRAHQAARVVWVDSGGTRRVEFLELGKKLFSRLSF